MNKDYELRNDIVKIIAMITMFIDHLGYHIFPYYLNEYYIIFRIVGRLAYPIFAYYLAIGFQRTSNLKNYILRMFIFALITQIPFYYFTGQLLYLNVMFTFTLGLMMLYFYERKNMLWIVFLILAQVLNTDYGAYGLAVILVFYLHGEDFRQSLLYFSLVTGLYVIMNIIGTLYISFIHFIQLFSIFSIPIIFASYPLKIRINKFIGYGFYPGHITLIVLIGNYLK
ncbi:MAG: TraX family protein [Spirochaetota bacterium]